MDIFEINVLLLVILVLLVLLYFRKSLITEIRIMLSAYELPGPPKINIVFGNTYALLNDIDNIHRTMKKWSLTYYPIYKLWAMNHLFIILLDPIDIEALLTNTIHNTKSELYLFLKKWLGTGLLTASGSKWQKRRKILTPAFHFNILQKFVSVFEEETQNLVQRIYKILNQNRNDVTIVNISHLIHIFTLSTMGRTAMGVKLTDESTQMEKDYKSSILKMPKVLLYRLLRPWLIPSFIHIFSKNYYQEKSLIKSLHTFTNHIINTRRLDYNRSNNNTNLNSKRLALLDLLLTAERENRIDENGIREEVDTFMFEGHDTVSIAISYALMLIANHPNIQRKLLDEIQTVLGPNLQMETITIVQLQNLTYMEMCIKETLRLYPSVHFVARKLGEDFKSNSGFVLPKGANVAVAILSLHSNPQFFPNPNQFDPDRFLPEAIDNIPLFAYLPFSAGSRNCIGKRFAMLEMKVLLVGILSNFVLSPSDTPETIEFRSDITLKPKTDIKVEFAPRYNFKCKEFL